MKYHYANLPLAKGRDFEMRRGQVTHKSATLEIVVPEGFELFQVLEIMGAHTARVVLVKS